MDFKYNVVNDNSILKTAAFGLLVTKTANVSIPQMSGINTPTYSFFPLSSNGVFVPKARISYTKSTLPNAVDNLSKIALYQAGNKISSDMTVAMSGSADADASIIPKDYYFQQNVYNGRVYNSSPILTLPAFTFPKSASGRYNPASQTVIFSWTMDAVTTGEAANNKIKIQYADNPNFDNPQSISVDYVASQTDYEFAVDKNLSPTMYFRVSREHSAFVWEIYKQASVNVGFDPIPSTAKAVVANNAALITWEPLGSAWLPGATFLITRANNTTKTSTEIKLTKEDFDKGVYTDNLIAICNSYTYTLQVVPPIVSSFTAKPATKAVGEVLPVEIGTINTLEASKGYFPDRTELRWTAEGQFDNFIIKRAVYGSNNFVQILQVPGSSLTEYQSDDTKGSPGVYYTYQVVGVVKCNNKNVFSNEAPIAIGFRSPTGNIYGRVTYDNGQNVEDVAVRVQSNDAAQTGRSILLNGNADSYLKLDLLILRNGQKREFLN